MATGLLITKILDVVIVNFGNSAILDGTAVEAIGKEIYALADEQAHRKVVLDMSAVRFLSSQMLGVLIAFQKKMAAIKGRFVICGLRADLAKVFKITQLDKLFLFAENEDKSLRSLGAFAPK
ncbi:MAG: STAS domain-containing protein [Planctomycetes bacterium]|nr:STAS domain-containing protein [Planctomycetota bacterium]